MAHEGATSRATQYVELFAARVHQVTPRYLVSGFYRDYSLTVALAACVVSAALACGVFASTLALLAWSVVALMSSTLLYRLLGGHFALDGAGVADWLYDVGVKSNVCDVLDALAPHAAARRSLRVLVLVVIALSLAVELTAWLRFSVLLTAASLLWVVYLLAQPRHAVYS